MEFLKTNAGQTIIGLVIAAVVIGCIALCQHFFPEKKKETDEVSR